MYTKIDSPLGELLLTGEATGRGVALSAVAMPDQRGAPRLGPHERYAPEAFADVAAQLGEYFAGQRRAFDVTLAETGTPFQRRVWAAVEEIGYGTTSTYG